MRHSPLALVKLLTIMEFAVTIALVLIAAAIAVVAGFASRVRAYNGTLRRLAEEYDGTFTPVRWFPGTGPTVDFSYKLALVRVRFESINGMSSPSAITLQVSWPDISLNYEVYPCRWYRRIASFINANRLKTGSRQFDHDFIVLGKSERDDVSRQLDAGVQRSIFRLARMQGMFDLSLKSTKETLSIRGIGQIHEDDRVVQFVRLGLELFDCVVQSAQGGITFVESSPGEGSDHASSYGARVDSVGLVTECMQHDAFVGDESVFCPLCRHPLEDRVVYCRQCRTPHHRECWRFHGACSIYGCGERRSTRAARPRNHS